MREGVIASRKWQSAVKDGLLVEVRFCNRVVDLAQT